MKKSWIVIGVIALFAIIIFVSLKNRYNKMVDYDNTVQKQWSEVQNQYKRRLDLIGNIVDVAKGYAQFEQATLTKVIEARAKATSTTINVPPGDPEAMQRFQQSQSEVNSALSRLLVTVEQYPDLKASKQFENIQVQLEGTENRIATARGNYITAVADYNGYIRRFPNNMLSGMFGFHPKPTFQAEAGAENAPNVGDMLENK